MYQLYEHHLNVGSEAQYSNLHWLTYLHTTILGSKYQIQELIVVNVRSLFIWFIWFICCICMQVDDCQIVVDPRTKESRGFAFVKMASADEAERCIKYLNRTVIEGRRIMIEKVLYLIFHLFIDYFFFFKTMLMVSKHILVNFRQKETVKGHLLLASTVAPEVLTQLNQ